MSCTHDFGYWDFFYKRGCNGIVARKCKLCGELQTKKEFFKLKEEDRGPRIERKERIKINIPFEHIDLFHQG